MKKKVLVSVLACALLFLGMGYAYWTDSLQVDTKVTTGELGVKFVDLALYGQYGDQDNEKSWSIIDGVGDGYVANYYFGRGTEYNIIANEAKLEEYQNRIDGYTKTTFDAKFGDPVDTMAELGASVDCYKDGTWASSTIKIDLNKIYPGYAQVFQSDIVNVGTVAAKLSDIDVIMGEHGTTTMKDVIGISMRLFREYSSTAGHSDRHVNVFPTSLFKPTDTFRLGGVDFIRLSALENENLDLKDYLENELLFVSPADNNRMDLYLGIAMDPDYDGVYTSGNSANPSTVSDLLTENKSANFSVKLLWDQFNVRAEDYNLTHEHLLNYDSNQ